MKQRQEQDAQNRLCAVSRQALPWLEIMPATAVSSIIATAAHGACRCNQIGWIDDRSPILKAKNIKTLLARLGGVHIY